MADHPLIEDYLARLAGEVAARADADDVVAEARDHLYAAVGDRVAAGDRERDATRFALDRFGDPALVARSLRRPRHPAVPTTTSRSAGTAALLGAAAWIALAMLWWLTHLLDEGSWGTGAQVTFMFATTVLMASVVLTALALHGLQQRHGGKGLLGVMTLVACGLALVASFVSWFLPGWASLLALAPATGALPLLRPGLAPRGALVALGLGWGLGLGVFALFELQGVGSVDEWGNHPVASIVGIGVGAVITAAGLFGVGRWLTGEEPVIGPGAALPAR